MLSGYILDKLDLELLQALKTIWRQILKFINYTLTRKVSYSSKSCDFWGERMNKVIRSLKLASKFFLFQILL